MPGTLRDDILAIPGIDNAELDGDSVTPDGVRVRLAFGADSQRVGREVRRVLALHGMRSQLTGVPDYVAPAEPPPPPVPEVGTVVNLADYEQAESRPQTELVTAAEPEAAVEPAEPDEPAEPEELAEPDEPDGPAEPDEPAEPEVEWDGIEPLLDEAAVAARPMWEAPEATVSDDHPLRAAPSQVEEPAAAGAAALGLAELGNVAVIEGASGVTVTVSTRMGKTSSRSAPGSATGIDRAVVSAVARLLLPDQDQPMLVEVMSADHDGERIVTAVLELEDGRHVVGSALQVADRSWAIARATRAALAVPE